jgi:hypothetical protein
VRTTLVAALAACAESKVRARARKFLSGLSADELQFIAGYLGARILQSAGQDACYEQWPAAAGVGCPADRDHKMILLVEYLRQSGGPGEYLST